ncbi:LOW QUALITY PROTEIN: hippocampus abundant transcript 1 protein [Drosophila obscura]|uniref:LOW QUALITY PROTEIN: hippocampus abundant transcript 1 protein n=1 Tax=Drosophila obscura TaxID=7282 RepID=UPI001BB16602|nr:LOW QUALITY PROTEIN: hippocampus abundant transcript 1 protein [Drosophila obscura]
MPRIGRKVGAAPTYGIGAASVNYTLIVILLEYSAWGLLTMPMIATLKETFPEEPFLMNGLAMGIKGILSFLSAPLIGALSDIWGRRLLLLVTVTFTCLPIPLMFVHSWWFFVIASFSGVFGVTFSVVLAYVADVTQPEERSRSYGVLSATFAASLVIFPALGNLLMDMYGINAVVLFATIIAAMDVLFVWLAVPESLPKKVRTSISWKQVNPFLNLRRMDSDKSILKLCLIISLLMLPAAGEYSCVPAYLKLRIGFDFVELSTLIAFIAFLSIAMNMVLGSLTRAFGAKRVILVGLGLNMLQLLLYSFGTEKWIMWMAGLVAALGSMSFAALSAYVSIYCDSASQVVVQDTINGLSSLCNGLGPAVFGLIFYLSDMDLSEGPSTNVDQFQEHTVAAPFMFGAICVLIAILVAISIPPGHESKGKQADLSEMHYVIEM